MEPALNRAAAQGLSKRPRLHDLCHTHASPLLGAGVPVIAVQRRLGHRGITAMVDAYGHLPRRLRHRRGDTNLSSLAFGSPAALTAAPASVPADDAVRLGARPGAVGKLAVLATSGDSELGDSLG